MIILAITAIATVALWSFVLWLDTRQLRDLDA